MYGFVRAETMQREWEVIHQSELLDRVDGLPEPTRDPTSRMDFEPQRCDLN